MIRILITCPPMIGMIKNFKNIFKKKKIKIIVPKIEQTLSEKELLKILPLCNGWIAGDDPASAKVLEKAKNGKLKAIIKWGVGVDNIDQLACKRLSIKFSNTPNVFGNEVADLAISYLIALSRRTFFIDRQIRKGFWPKPPGTSLKNKKVGLIGFGDIGKSIAKRLLSLEAKTIIYDPNYLTLNKKVFERKNFFIKKWPNFVNKLDFIIICCSLTKSSFHLINSKIISKFKKGIQIVNVGRGAIINQKSLEKGLKNQIIDSVALDVFENEPLHKKTILRSHPYCILGSHNSSNTKEAVLKVSTIAIKKILNFLNIK